jgi:hypothetical protein
MFDHMDGVILLVEEKKTPWKKDKYFAVMVAHQKLPKYSAHLTPTTTRLPTHIPN